MKGLLTEVFQRTLPALAGFAVGVPVGGLLVWWIWL